jgi:hypothetical protein
LKNSDVFGIIYGKFYTLFKEVVKLLWIMPCPKRAVNIEDVILDIKKKEVKE